MMDNGKRRPRRQLSPEEKWEIFLEVTSQEISQADAARNSLAGEVSRRTLRPKMRRHGTRCAGGYRMCTRTARLPVSHPADPANRI
jgi:hypothetical protein